MDIIAEIYYELQNKLVVDGKDPVVLVDGVFKQNDDLFREAVIEARNISIEAALDTWINSPVEVNIVKDM